MATIRMTLEEVVGYFDELEDPRGTINQKHPFVSVVVIALMAVLAGASGPTAIAQWAKYKEAFLRRVLDLPNGVPRKDVFRRVLSLLNPAAFQACFAAWLKSAARAGGRSDRDRAAHLGRGRQDGPAQPRPQQGSGRVAFGQRVGQRVWAVAGASGLRREIQRNHGHSRAVAAGGHPRRDHHHRRDGNAKSDRRADHRAESGLRVGAQRQPRDVA